jgi:subtilisin family serine protease
VLFKKEALPPDFYEVVASLGGEVVFAHEIGIAGVSGLSDETMETFSSRKDVEAVMRDQIYTLESHRGVISAFPPTTLSPGDPTGAGGYARQWNMQAIGADQAWAADKLGSEDVTVAILDTGIDYLYPDLLGRVDLERSISLPWNAYPMGDDDEWIDNLFPGREYFSDLHGHGTHVASIIASNAWGLAGVSTRTKLMAVKVCNAYGACSLGQTINGLLYAAANGADVANLSLGGWKIKWLMHPTGWFLGHFFKRTFTVANRAGMTVVVAAGNEGLNLDRNHRYMLKLYCDMPNVLCVSATGPTAGGEFGPWSNIDTFAPYSNYGQGVLSVAAPGGTGNEFGPESGAWVWGACSTTTWDLPECQNEYLVIGYNGTSQAAPHVSGIAALVVSEVGRRPELVRQRVRKGADDLGTPGTDDFYGRGRVNVCGSIECGYSPPGGI